MDSFYSDEELKRIGIKQIGENVLVSKKTSIYSPEKIIIGNNVRIDDFCILSGEIKIGNYVHISAGTYLYGKSGIVINDFCGCSARTTIYSAVDDFSGEYLIGPMVPSEYINLKSGRVILNKYVQLGVNTVVMPGVVINEGTVTGAFSFVNKNFEAWKVIAGIPAKIIKNRSKGMIGLSAEILKNKS